MPKVAICASLAFLLLLAADNPLEGDKFLQKADEKFDQAATRAQEAYAKAMGEAYETKLKTYRGILAAATKAGDFDRAAAVKGKIEELEKEQGEIGVAGTGKKKLKPRPKNTFKFGGHEYALIEDRATWHVAQKRCEEMGGHLAIVETAEEENFILSRKFPISAWFGASDEEVEGRWFWLNGERVALPITASGGPDHYLLLVRGQSWEDGETGLRSAYVCEWDR